MSGFSTPNPKDRAYHDPLGLHHSWIEVTSPTGCIYSFGLMAYDDDPSTAVRHPDLIVSVCQRKINECGEAIKSGSNYTDKKGNIIVPHYEVSCRRVCRGVSEVYADDVNKGYPKFQVTGTGKLNPIQLEILRWFITGAKEDEYYGLVKELPFVYSLTCTLVKGKNKANCQSMAQEFHANPKALYLKLMR